MMLTGRMLLLYFALWCFDNARANVLQASATVQPGQDGGEEYPSLHAASQQNPLPTSTAQPQPQSEPSRRCCCSPCASHHVQTLFWLQMGSLPCTRRVEIFGLSC
jgi:hypothetical protein